MSTEVAERERRRVPIRAPLTGLVLVLIIVFGTYYGWQAAFGVNDLGAAADGCATTPSTTATTTTTTPGTTPPTTTTVAVIPAAAVTTMPATTTVPPTDPNVLNPADVTVNVYNATVRRGLANNTAALLRERGFHISAVQNDPLEATIPGVAEIRAATVDSAEVRLLAQHVPGAVVVADSRTDSSVDLVLGETFVALGDPATVTPVPIATPRC
jgi:hypothetical protein